ncbi:MAG: hypothetical protein ACYDDI_03170 [Candidatus Acidiferrales bacterium]
MRLYFASACAFLGVLSVLFAVGCGANGPSLPPISVAITSPASPATIQAGQAVNVVASVSSDMSNKGVTWSQTGQGSLTNQTSVSVTYTAPASVPAGFSLGSPLSAALSISANGSGSLGANTVAVTNGTVLSFIDETSTLPPVVQVFEP